MGMDLTCNFHIPVWSQSVSPAVWGSCSPLCSVPALLSEGQHMHALHRWDAFLSCLCVSSVSVTPSPLIPFFFACISSDQVFAYNNNLISYHVLRRTCLCSAVLFPHQLCLPLLLSSTLGPHCSADWEAPCHFFLILL